jgi:hypothetical protein
MPDFLREVEKLAREENPEKASLSGRLCAATSKIGSGSN